MALTVALFHLIGAVGIPIAAYSCDESGQGGVVSFVSGSERDCYVDSCCDGDETQSSTYIQRDIPCCELDIHNPPDNGRTLPPTHKQGQADPLAETPARLAACGPNVRIACALPFGSVFHASINLPLRT